MKKFITIIATLALLALLGTLLMACGTPASPSEAEKKLNKKGYNVTIVDVNEEIKSEFGADDALKYLYAVDEKNGDYLNAFYFENSAKAKAYYKAHKDTMTAASGQWAYGGTDRAIDAFKG